MDGYIQKPAFDRMTAACGFGWSYTGHARGASYLLILIPLLRIVRAELLRPGT
jgi:hypothetical protein